MSDVRAEIIGKLATLLGYDGADFRNILVDAAGHPQIDVLSTAINALAATAAHQVTMITALQLIDDLRNALATVGADQLRVNVLSSALPNGATTSVTQGLILAQLQRIEDLRAALASVHTDRLVVRGMDQIVTFKSNLSLNVNDIISGAGGYILVATVPAGEVWHIWNVQSLDATSATTMLYLYYNQSAVNYDFAGSKQARAAAEAWYWHGNVVLIPADYLRLVAVGGLVGDRLYCRVTGFKFTLET